MVATGGLLFGSLAGAVALAGPVPAAFAYGHQDCTISASPSVQAGHNFTAHISCTGGYTPGDSFTITVCSSSSPVGTITLNSGGQGSGNFTMPSTTPSGSCTLKGVDGSGVTVATSIEVVGAAAVGAASSSSGSTSHSALAFTGTDVALTAGIGAAAIGAGGAFVLVSRRRRQVV